MSANDATPSPSVVPCLDFAEFKRVITERRVVDDHISHALNTTVPTQSNVDNVDARTNCQRLFKQLTEAHDTRTNAIRTCLEQVNTEIESIQSSLGVANVDRRAEQGKGRTSPDEKQLRELQSVGRQIRRELVAEEILQETTNKVYKDRCGRYYKPPGM